MDAHGIRIDDHLKRLEVALKASKGPDTATARTELLAWLRGCGRDEEHELSVAQLLADVPISDRRECAPVILRCLAVEGLIATTSQGSNLARSVVSLCETGFPEIIEYLKINQKDQTYKKYDTLTLAHARIEELLSPLRAPVSDIESVLSSRKNITGKLSHTIVRRYCAKFGHAEVVVVVGDVFSKLAVVAELRPSLLSDVEACRKAVSDGIASAQEVGSFLSDDLLIFLQNVENALDKFLTASRSKFGTKIVSKLGSLIQKRYPLHEPGREIHISLPFTNQGPGLAKDLRVSVTSQNDALFIANPSITLGNVRPGDFSVLVDGLVIERSDCFALILHFEWSEIGETTTKTEIFELTADAQAADTAWADIEFWNPYSIEPAEGDEFVGREQKVRSLASKMLRNPMESFYITGQKRTGKTSLALAVASHAKESSQSLVSPHYVLWGHIAHEDPRASLHALGVSIEEFICAEIASLPKQGVVDYSGSLAPLIKLADLAFKLAPSHKFVIIVDEFDEIHQELYLQGNLAETFFANLRALSRARNICLVLVGGENMPFIMERQGQKLNNFSRASLSYYSRSAEWSDFRLLIEIPTSGVIAWHEDAIAEVFNLTNGNPYFAKLICASVLRHSVQQRDADITSDEVLNVSEQETSLLGSNYFVHLWQDGIPKPVAQREPEILLRARVLVAIARSLRRNSVPTLSDIAANRGTINVSEGEIGSVLSDFVRREVLYEKGDGYEFALPLFKNWLEDVGFGQLAADSLSADLAYAVLTEEQSASVRASEIVDLVKSWPTYRGRHVTSEDVRVWLKQVDSVKDQRILFEIIKRVRFFSETRIREHLNSAFSFLVPVLAEYIYRRPSDRRGDVIITYVDGEGKSGSTYATLFAEENKISVKGIYPPGEFSHRFNSYLGSGGQPSVIVILDDIAATGTSLAKNVAMFLSRNEEVLNRAGVPIRVISVLATADAQRGILRSMGEGNLDVDFRACEIIGDESQAFPASRAGWKSEADFERAVALCRDLGSNIYGKQSPLGFGGLGLNVVFPTTVPNNSLPILHSSARSGSGHTWTPLFPRVTHG